MIAKRFLLFGIAFIAMCMAAKAQKPDFVANWNGVRTTNVVGGKHEPYKAFIGINLLKNLNKVLINEYETDYQYHDGMLAVFNKETRGWGFVDENGKRLPGGYKWTFPNVGESPAFASGHVIVGKPAPSTGSVFRHTDYYVLDKYGAAVKLPVQDLSAVTPFNNQGIAAVVPKGLGSKVIFFNTRGQQVFRNITNAVRGYSGSPIGDFISGWARLELGQGCTYVSPNGTLMQKTFKDAQDFSDGLAAVAVETGSGVRWGFIDSTGRFVIEPKFSNRPSPFSFGYAVVKKTNGKMVFINKQGSVCGSEADYYTNFVNGYALGTVREYSYGSRGGDVWVIDTLMQRRKAQSQILGGENIESICKTLPVATVFDDTYIYYANNKWLIYPPTGETYRMDGFAVSYDDKIDKFSNRRVHITIKATIDGGNKVWDGFLDENGILVWVFDKDEF